MKPALASIVLALGTTGFCSASELTTEEAFFSDLPVVASVSRLPQRLADAPTAVTVIDRQMIKASGVRSLSDVFRLVPGFQTHMNNTDSARVTYHGLTDETFSPRLQVLVDGRSMHSPLFRNGVNWAVLPVALEDIERIEVVRGTNAVSYGTNAFLGVINIVTADSALSNGFSVSANHGNQGVRDYTLRAGGKLGSVGNVRLTYQQQDDEGIKDQYDWVDSFRSRLFDMRSDLTVTDSDSVQIGLGHVEAILPRGRKLTKNNVVIPGVNTDWPIHDFAQSHSYLGLIWRHVRSADSEFQVRYNYSMDWASDRYTVGSATPSYDIDEFGDKGTRHEVEFQHLLSLNRQLRLVWGTGWRNDVMQSETLFRGQRRAREVGRVFGNLEWKPIHWFTGNLGLASEHDSLAGWSNSPRISGNFHVTPENTFRIGYSRAYRSGSIAEYKADWFNGAKYQYRGDQNMPQEQLEASELGYLGDWRNWRMSLDIRWFYEKVRNRLYAYDESRFSDLAPDVTGPIQNVAIRGLEYQWRWRPFDQTRILVNQSFIRINSAYLPVADDPLNSFSITSFRQNVNLLAERSAPRYSNSVMLMQTLPFGVEFSIAGYWQDRMKWSRNSEVYAFNRVDARIGYPFKLIGKGGEIAYTVQSLNGSHGEYRYEDKNTDRVVDRRHWLSLRLDF